MTDKQECDIIFDHLFARSTLDEVIDNAFEVFAPDRNYKQDSHDKSKALIEAATRIIKEVRERDQKIRDYIYKACEESRWTDKNCDIARKAASMLTAF